MKLGSEPECTARSTESIPTKNTNRKKERDLTTFYVFFTFLIVKMDSTQS